jgi:DNA-binding HxlR family transcriptional regulator
VTYDCPPFVADCRVRAATDLLTHTWDPVVLMALRYGARRRRELLAAIGGISDKALTQSLRRLVDNGLLIRVGDRPGVVYALSARGQSLVDGPMTALAEWAVENA